MQRRISTRAMSHFAIAWLAVVVAMAPLLAAQTGSTYYVSTSGNDSNPGTMGSPWLTIQHAANSVTAGVHINDDRNQETE